MAHLAISYYKTESVNQRNIHLWQQVWNKSKQYGYTWAGTYKNRKGQLFIGYRKGFYTFSPEELAVKTDLKIIITDFFINTLPVLPGKGSPLQKQVEEISDLDLKYNQNNIAFNFAAIDYREPETIKYFTCWKAMIIHGRR